MDKQTMKRLSILIMAISGLILLVLFSVFFVVNGKKYSNDYKDSVKEFIHLARKVNGNVKEKKKRISLLMERQVALPAFIQHSIVKGEAYRQDIEKFNRVYGEDSDLMDIAVYLPNGKFVYSGRKSSPADVSSEIWYKEMSKISTPLTRMFITPKRTLKIIKSVHDRLGEKKGYLTFEYGSRTLGNEILGNENYSLDEKAYISEEGIIFFSKAVTPEDIEDDRLFEDSRKAFYELEWNNRAQIHYNAIKGEKEKYSILTARLPGMYDINIGLVLPYTPVWMNFLRFILLFLPLTLLVVSAYYYTTTPEHDFEEDEDYEKQFTEEVYEYEKEHSHHDSLSLDEEVSFDKAPSHEEDFEEELDNIDFSAPSAEEISEMEDSFEDSIDQIEMLDEEPLQKDITREEPSQSGVNDVLEEDEAIHIISGDEIEEEENEYFSSEEAFGGRDLGTDFLGVENRVQRASKEDTSEDIRDLEAIEETDDDEESVETPKSPVAESEIDEPIPWDLAEDEAVEENSIASINLNKVDISSFNERLLKHEVYVESPVGEDEIEEEEELSDVPRVPDEYYEKNPSGRHENLTSLIDNVTDGEISLAQYWKQTVFFLKSLSGEENSFESVIDILENTFPISVEKALYAEETGEGVFEVSNSVGISDESKTVFNIQKTEKIYKNLLSSNKLLYIKSNPFASKSISKRFAEVDKENVKRLLFTPVESENGKKAYFVLMSIGIKS